MSKQSLSNFLKKLDKELQGSSSEYRYYTANKRTQIFIYLPRVLKEQLYKEFEFRNLTSIFNKQDLQQYITTKANNILVALRQNAQSMKNSRDVKIISNANFISVALQKEVNPTSKSSKSTLYDNFTKLRTLYKNEIDLFVKDLVSYLEKEYDTTLTTTEKEKGRYDDIEKRYIPGQNLQVTNKRVSKGSDLFEGGHEKGEGVLETRMRDALNAALNEGYLNKAERKALQQNLKLLGINISVVRDDSDDSHTFKIESRVKNQKEGMLSAQTKEILQKQLNEAILRLDSRTPIAGLKGSDSVIERKNKKTLQKIAKPFSKINGVVLQGFEKPDKATPRSSVLPKPTKSSKKEAVGISKVSISPIKTRRNIQKGVSSSPLMLIGLINQKLPQTVQKNMREPNLVNRSGRFAQSARVVDVITTPQGYLSFGYTYMKNPYQTFEAGFAQGDVDRDPRNILDQSIREIAVQFALGRFYTRRV